MKTGKTNMDAGRCIKINQFLKFDIQTLTIDQPG